MAQLGLNLGFLVPAVLCWLGSLYCLGRLRDRAWDPAIAAITMSFVARGLAFLAGAPVVYRFVHDLTGLANLPRLIINICGIVWSVAILIALAYWNKPSATAQTIARRWSLGATVIVLVTSVLWFGAEVPETATNFSEHHGHDLSVATYMLMYHGSLTVALVSVVVCCLRYAQLTDVTRLRYGMWLTALGAAVYLSFCLHRMATLVGPVVKWSPGSWPSASPVATGIGAALMMVGLTMPMWGTGIAEIRSRRRAYARHRQMTRLWSDLSSIAPAIALPIADDSSLGIEFRLYRRMIEIRDGLLAISAYLPTEPSDPGNADPRRTADRIRRAIRAVRDGQSPPAAAGVHHVLGAECDDEAEWLAAVSVAYARVADAEQSTGVTVSP